MEKNDERRFVELQWTCPNCSSENKGSHKTCENCGGPQPDNVQFHRATDEQIVADEKKISAAKAGADIHCGFCGTRNPGNAVTCSQCGGDLKEGKARAAGQILEAAPAAPKILVCANCGAENPGSARTCAKCGSPLPRAASKAAPRKAQAMQSVNAQPGKTNWLLFGGIGAAILLCCVAIFLMVVLPAKSAQGTVTRVEWQTSVPVEEIQPVHYANKSGSAPSGAYNVSCQTESEEVCEDKTVDQGNGFAEVVRECHTNDTQYCDYTVDEWTTIQTYTLNGTDNFPVYDDPSIIGDQRLGTATETLTVYFSTDEGQETYSPSSTKEFQEFEVGSVWTLNMNVMGAVLSVER